ncbi:MAG: C25 family cysteine peptidase [Acidobacteriota bacterium]
MPFRSLFLLLLFLLSSLAAPLVAQAGFEVQSGALSSTFETPIFDSFTFAGTFQVPPAVFAVGSQDGGNPCDVRIRNVTTTGFEAACVEPPGYDGEHLAMAVNFVIVEPGVHELPLVGGGALTVESACFGTQTVQHNCASGCGTTGWDSIAFSPELQTALAGSSPAVLAQVQTMANESGNPPATVSTPFLSAAVENISGSGVQLALERSEVDDGSVTVDETMCWLALRSNGCAELDVGGGASVDFESIVTGAVVDGWDDGCNPGEGATFACSYSQAPTVVANLANRAGADGGWLRRCSTSTSDVTFTIDEDDDKDSERNHILQPISVLAFAEDFAMTVATHASVTSVTLLDSGEVAWTTTSEAGTAGFYLASEGAADSRHRLHEFLVPSSFRAEGGHYRQEAPELAAGDVVWIEELEVNGTSLWHGPFELERGGPVAESGLRSSAAVSSARTSSSSVQLPSDSGLPPVLAVHVDAPGLIQLDAAQLAAAFGTSINAARHALATQHFDLTRNGVSTPWIVRSDGGALLFLVQPSEVPVAGDAVFVVAEKPGRAFARKAISSGVGVPAILGLDSIDFERDTLAATVLPLDPLGDYWFWTGVSAGSGDVDLAFDLPELEGGVGTAQLRLRLQSASLLEGVQHEARVRLNGVELGQTSWSFGRDHEAHFDVPIAHLFVEGNVLTVEGLAGAVPNQFFVDGFTLASVPRRLDRQVPRSFSVANVGAVTAGSSTAADLLLFDVTGLEPQRLVGAATTWTGTAWSVQLLAEPGVEYAVVAESSALVPRRIATLPRARLDDPKTRADYVVIAPSAWADSAQRLVDRRRSQGLEGLLVELETITTEFGYGVPSAEAVRSFLANAHASWELPPSMVTFVGAGHFDDRDLLGHGVPHFPVALRQTDAGLFASDAAVGDLDGDGWPELAVGRLPVTSLSELDSLLGRIEAYERGGGPSFESAVLASDFADEGGNFRKAAVALQPSVPFNWSVDQIAADDLGAGAARAELLRAFEVRQGLVVWLGHGGLDRLSKQDLLLASDVGQLDGDSTRPLFLSLSCVTNRFEVPGFASLGEELLLGDGGGVIASLAPTGVARTPAAVRLGHRLLAALTAGPGTRLGPAVVAALRRSPDAGSDLLGSLQLLGDAALLLPFEEPVPVPSEPLHTDGFEDGTFRRWPVCGG